MKENKKRYFVNINNLGHSITLDLRKIVAISHPNKGDKYFCVYFNNGMWKVSISEHDSLFQSWMALFE